MFGSMLWVHDALLFLFNEWNKRSRCVSIIKVARCNNKQKEEPKAEQRAWVLIDCKVESHQSRLQVPSAQANQVIWFRGFTV